jgi:glucose/arabinose dehydrogenase
LNRTVSDKARVNLPKSTSGEFRIEEFVANLNVPWSIAFTSTDRALISERGGQIRVVEKGQLREKPLFVFNDIYGEQEAGLMGLTVDPDYTSNKFIYASYAYNKNGKPRIKVVRLEDQGDKAVLEKVIIDDILAAPYHDGSRIKFGPDRKLYITTGDATQKELAQKMDSPNGKILRLNPDGSIPNDNPFPGSPIYSYGHRNPQGITWDPISGAMWETEHGPSGFDGPGGGDEINLIKAGGNYGWPKVSHERDMAGAESPKLVFTPAIAPGGTMIYTGKLFPQFKNNLFFTGLRGEGVWRAVISDEGIASFERMKEIDVGRVRDVLEGPDGAIYFLTSNRDGRGNPRTGDDKIYRIIP